MAIDFPASPAVGSTFTSGGATWQWDGVKWVPASSGQNFLPISGGNLTGPLGGTTATFSGLVTAGSETVTGALSAGTVSAASGAFTGNVTSADPPAGDSSAKLATTEWIAANRTMGRNRLINGGFRIDQWNAGAGITPTTSGTPYCCDRFKLGLSQGSKLSAQQVGIATGNLPASIPAQAALLLKSQSAYTLVASDYFYLSQGIEGYNWDDMLWGTVNAAPIVLQFIGQASVPGLYSGALRNSAAARSYPFTFNLTTAVTLITIQIPGDTAGTWVPSAENAVAMLIDFDLGAGATYRSATANAWVAGNFVGASGAASLVATNGASMWITNIKLEKGLVATPFDNDDVQIELARCQRYYERSYDLGTASGAVGNNTNASIQLLGASAFAAGLYSPGITIPFKAVKRAAPTITGYSPATGASGKARDYTNGADVTLSTSNFGTNSFFWQAALSVAQSSWNIQIMWTANAEL